MIVSAILKGAPATTENIFNGDFSPFFSSGTRTLHCWRVPRWFSGCCWRMEDTVSFPPKSGLGTPSSYRNPIYPHILTFDLGVDVLQFIIVLADGSLITTNSFQYPDLFWALHSGGGGTYGIITSSTYQLIILPLDLGSHNP